VQARYAQLGVPLLRSDRCGALTWRTAALGEDTLACQRSLARRYWHHPEPSPMPER
jgi:competence protein ComEC